MKAMHTVLLRYLLLGILALYMPFEIGAATLPPHHPLRILIVSDAVNPHGLSDSELTQPGDISAALLAPNAGLVLDNSPENIREIATNDIDLAAAALSLPFDEPNAYDVLIYFAHRIPNDDSAGQNAADQAAFVTAVESFLIAGGGVVSFHHGAYQTSGKEGIQALIGATATGSVPWNMTDGQNVINVSPGHFVTTNGVEYPSMVSYADAPRGVPAATYPFFNNVPDERYIDFEINPTASDFHVLFASDYIQNGSTHLLGFTHQAPGWSGLVVGYQPGEYQPNALDDPNGNNFQILANAIVFTPAGAFIGDFNLDRLVNAEDIELLFDQIAAPSNPDLFDLTGDATINQADLLELITIILQTNVGDANLDGQVGMFDLLILAQNWGQPTAWSTGDFNGDNQANFLDLANLAINWQTVN
jgi:hypothetical protein